jgi:SAM-dependent methyltransferase
MTNSAAYGAGSPFVQYGCGLCAPKGWRNFDASPTLRLQRVPVIGLIITAGCVRFPANAEFGDVANGLPLPSRSCKAVYCSHILEHLSLEDFRRTLRETHRILRPGGIFRGVLPDLELCVRAYVADGSAGAAVQLMKSTLLGVRERAKGLVGLAKEVFGNSNHLWMWDYKALEAELQDTGFTDIRRAVYGDSPEPAFAAVEDEDRWRDSLGFECRG